MLDALHEPDAALLQASFACSYASTCQTVGMNLGYFTSFTVFLALNDPDFCNSYLRAKGSERPQGLILLSHYLSFWGWAYLIITVCVWLFKREDNFQALGIPGIKPACFFKSGSITSKLYIVTLTRPGHGRQAI